MRLPARVFVVALLALLATAPARASVLGAYVTVGVAVNLGPVEDRARVGVALGGGAQMFWSENSEEGPSIAPLTTISAHLAWTRPVTPAQIAVTAGAMYPLVVGDAGFIPLAGAQVGAGLGLATDGAAGPVFVGQLLAPFAEVRFDAVWWKRALHAPRLSAALSVENCCSSNF